MRFVHAVPGAPEARLSAGTGVRLAPLGVEGFGGGTAYRRIPEGTYAWSLDAATGHRHLAGGEDVRFTRGAWTLVATARDGGLQMLRFRDTGPRRGTALLRMIHAAPELGRPNLMLGTRTVAREVPFTKATPYLPLRPGRYDVSAVAPGSGRMVLEGKVTVKAGEATTAIVMGSRGMAAQIVTFSDRDVKASRESGSPDRGAGDGEDRDDGARTVLVGKGDSLWSIARGQVGDGASSAALAAYVERLWARNAHHVASGRPDLIPQGARLVLP